MPDILLTLHCASADTEVIVEALRRVTRAPLHMRSEAVHGRDFADATSVEQVTATLKRSAIECVESDVAIADVISAAKAAKRTSPFRWHQTPVLAQGRFE